MGATIPDSDLVTLGVSQIEFINIYNYTGDYKVDLRLTLALTPIWTDKQLELGA